MGENIREALQRLAELVNQQPEAERAELKAALGEYTHDLKHTLGLVTGANALVARIAADEAQIGEMTKIINSASGQLDELVNLIVEELNNQIWFED